MEVLPLEKPLLELSNRISELRVSARQAALAENRRDDRELSDEIRILEAQFESLAKETFSNLSPYEVTQLSRHPHRPYTLDIVNQLCTDFIELSGDRNFMEDASIVGGLAQFRGRRVMIIGHQKGRGTKENVKRNFGMPRPEGYRKALRLMSMAERFSLPIVTFVDTPGAYPGMDAEERGQSEAIAKNIMVMSKLMVPIVTVVVGEGGSGGALAIAVGNRVLMMQYAVYSVISPEGCASILWKDSSQADRAAKALCLTAKHALDLGVIDDIVPEPLGAAHWKPQEAIQAIGDYVEKHLTDLAKLSKEELRDQRMHKYMTIGRVQSMPPISPFRAEKAPIAGWDESWESVIQSLDP
jgi:acetyl-CoA carboxylase carboxyl transferase subunit alpha